MVMFSSYDHSTENIFFEKRVATEISLCAVLAKESIKLRRLASANQAYNRERESKRNEKRVARCIEQPVSETRESSECTSDDLLGE